MISAEEIDKVQLERRGTSGNEKIFANIFEMEHLETGMFDIVNKNAAFRIKSICSECKLCKIEFPTIADKNGEYILQLGDCKEIKKAGYGKKADYWMKPKQFILQDKCRLRDFITLVSCENKPIKNSEYSEITCIQEIKLTILVNIFLKIEVFRNYLQAHATADIPNDLYDISRNSLAVKCRNPEIEKECKILYKRERGEKNER